jgi:hypothetical protein
VSVGGVATQEIRTVNREAHVARLYCATDDVPRCRLLSVCQMPPAALNAFARQGLDRAP